MKIIKKTEPIIIKNKDYKRCLLLISFPIEKITDMEGRILKCILFDKSKKYDTKYKKYEAQVKNHCAKFNCKITKIGDTNFLDILLIYPSKEAIKKDYLKDNLLFLKDMIYNPILKNGLINPDLIKELAELYKLDKSNPFNDSIEYYYYQNKKLIDENNYLADPYKENPKLIDKLTPKRITNLYKKIISKKPMAFLIGNVSNNSKKIIMENFYDNKIETIEFEANYKHYFKNIPDEIIYKKEESKYNNSVVFYNFKVKNPTEKDEILISIISNMLDSSSSMILFDKLRIEKNLVYRCGVKSSANKLLLSIWASFSKDKIEKVKKTFDEVLEYIKNKEVLEEYLLNISKKAEVNKLLHNNIDEIFNYEIDKYIGYLNNSFYDELFKIKADDLLDFLNNKLTLVSIYEGVGIGE